jgi:hypothetical protein
LSIFGLVAAACTAFPTTAGADDLIMPYACEMDHGSPHLSPASANIYHIYGHREDRAVPACASPSGSCETMMVHKFFIECAGFRVPWARVAASAPAIGVQLPAGLPEDFAPISRFRGRFVLPGFSRVTRFDNAVSEQTLSPDSVIETGTIQPHPHAQVANWVTVVDPDATVQPASPAAFKVAGIVSMLLVSLMAGCLLVAWRRPLLSLERSRMSNVRGALAEGAARLVTTLFSAFRHSYESWQAAADGEGGDRRLADSLALVHARLRETELLVATLASDLLLRQVLESELDGLRQRAADVARRAGRLGAERASGMVRLLTRDLDRITRIVHGAAQRGEAEPPTAPDPPASVYEAYRVLGLNSDAPHAAVKKVVDALRMSWHPDHARDEADRLYREQHIKQINAAWDLLKGLRAAVA